MSTIYFCGGMFQSGKPNVPPTFGMVRPTGGLPYVRFTAEEARGLFNLCRHHSHLYKTDDGQTAVLEQLSYEAEVAKVAAPREATLSEEHRREIFQAVASREALES